MDVRKRGMKRAREEEEERKDECILMVFADGNVVGVFSPQPLLTSHILPQTLFVAPTKKKKTFIGRQFA